MDFDFPKLIEEIQESMLDSKKQIVKAECRSIRVGDYKCNPPLEGEGESFTVVFSERGILFTLPHVQSHKAVVCALPIDNILMVEASYKKNLPLLFLATGPRLAKSLRKLLGMSDDPKDQGYHYDPQDGDKYQKRIVFLFTTITEEASAAINNIFGRTLSEIDNVKANSILCDITRDDGGYRRDPLLVSTSTSFPGNKKLGTSLVDEFKRNRRSELGLEVVESMASQFQVDMDKEVDIRDELRSVSRRLERATKSVLHILQRIHLEAESDQKTVAIGETGMASVVKDVTPIMTQVGEKVPLNQYHKYADFFRNHVIRSVFAIGLSKFLVDGSFATVQFVAEILQIPTAETRQDGGIFLEWEEYLEGMIDVGQELARLAKNCVILDNYALVGKIHGYISTLTYGFSGMNFRNDGLRRRYDSLKYDSRAIEEVVYDLKMQKSENV